MANRKPTNKYYFTVEGETEHWYLKWLQDVINKTDEAVCKVSIDCPIEKNPLKRAKSLTVTGKTEIYHLFDYESDDNFHVEAFQNAMDNMKKAEKIGKQIKYKGTRSNGVGYRIIVEGSEECMILEMYDELEPDKRGRLLGYPEALRNGLFR